VTTAAPARLSNLGNFTAKVVGIGALVRRGSVADRQLPGDVERQQLPDLLGPVLAAGLLVGSAGDTVLRLTPPLTIDAAQVGLALELLEEVLA